MSAAQKDAVLQASIDFIGSLTGMKPPPIETAPAETFRPFKEFADKVCAIFAEPQTNEVAQEVEPGVNQLVAQLHDDQKWTVSEQQQFAQFLKRFPNESSQGIMSLGDAWKHGKACAAPTAWFAEPAPQAVNAELLEALQAILAAADSPLAQGGEMWFAEAVSQPIEAARAALAKAGAQP